MNFADVSDMKNMFVYEEFVPTAAGRTSNENVFI